MLALHFLSEGGEGPNTELLFILLILLGSFALTVVVGWMSSSKKPNRVQAENETHPTKKEAETVSAKPAKSNKPSKAGRRKK